MELNKRSLDNLAGVHPDLVAVIKLAAERAGPVWFIVSEGVRTKERQRVLFDTGKSKTLNSRHIPGADGLGKAVDLAVWEDRDEDKVVDADELSWKFPMYRTLAGAIKAAAAELGVPVVWGGDWESYKDAAVHRVIAEALETVANGECLRLLLSVPPQHGKSELCSRKFPAWFCFNLLNAFDPSGKHC